MKKIEIFLSFCFALFALVVIIFFIKTFDKKTQDDIEGSLNKGYGYYSNEVSLGCATENCSEIGTETFVQHCIVNPETGNYCIGENGEYTTKSVYRTQPCRTQCYSSQLGSYSDFKTTKLNDPSSVTNSSEKYTVNPESQLRIYDESTGVDYTEHFGLKMTIQPPDPKYILDKCINEGFSTYTLNTIYCNSNNTSGDNQCKVFCSRFNTNSTTVRSNGGLINSYPEEFDINTGQKIKVCYDIHNNNQLEILKTSSDVPGNFVFPDECYKHSKFIDFEESTINLWPDKGSSNIFGVSSNFNKYTRYFSFTGQNLENFNSVKSIVTPGYNMQQNINGYSKVLLNSEITLMDKIYDLGTSYLDNNSLQNDFCYVRRSTGYNPIGVTGHLHYEPFTSIPSFGGHAYYPFLKSDIFTAANSPGTSPVYYFNSGTSEYFHFQKGITLDSTKNYIIDSPLFKSIPFKVNNNVSSSTPSTVYVIKDSGVSQISLNSDFNQNFIRFSGVSGNQIYEFSGIGPSVVMFTNNCYLDKGIDLRNSNLNTNYQVKKNKKIDVPFYVYGTSTGNGLPTYKYPLYQSSTSIPPTGGTSHSFQEYPNFYFYSNSQINESKYTLESQTDLPNFSDLIGIGSVNSITRKTIFGEFYPSNLRITNGGVCYTPGASYSLYNFLETNVGKELKTNIGICINKSGTNNNLIQNIKILRNSSVEVTQNIDSTNYRDKKIQEYFNMLKNQEHTPPGRKISEIIIFPEYSLTKVTDLSVFKTPYLEDEFGNKDFVCFDGNNNFNSDKVIELNPGDELFTNLKVDINNYIDVSSDKGISPVCTTLVLEETKNPPVNYRSKDNLGLCPSVKCLENLVKTTDYTTVGNFLEPCLVSLDLVKKEEDRMITGKFFTREIEENKTYDIDEDTFTRYNFKDYFLNTNIGKKEKIYFYENAVNVYENQLITEIFDNSQLQAIVNNGLGPTNQSETSSIFSNIFIPGNYSKQVTYQVSRKGFVPSSPSNYGMNFYHGHGKSPSFVSTNSSSSDNAKYVAFFYLSSIYYSNYYSFHIFSDFPAPPTITYINDYYGVWNKLKFERKSSDFLNYSSPLNDFDGPVKIRFDIVPTAGLVNNTFTSRFYDDTLKTPWNNLNEGDYISPDFTYFNSLFLSIFSGVGATGTSLISNLLLEPNNLKVGSNIITASGCCTKNKSFTEGDYLLLGSKPDTGLYSYIRDYYPTFEVGKIIETAKLATGATGVSIYISRNVNNTKLEYLPTGYSSPVILNLGKNDKPISNNIINNYYQIKNIGIDTTYGQKFLEFDFNINSITNQYLTGGTTGTFVSATGTNLTKFQDQIKTSRNFTFFTPAVSAKYFKNNITFPSDKNCVIFSNDKNSKLNTRMLSYVTSIKNPVEATTGATGATIKSDPYYYINEFREDYNLLDKQIPLTFKTGDVIKYYTNQPFNFSEEKSTTGMSPYITEYINTMVLRVDKTNCYEYYSEKGSSGTSQFKYYDYQCSLVYKPFSQKIYSGTSPSNFYYNRNMGTSLIYKDFYKDNNFSLDYCSYDTGNENIKLEGGVSCFKIGATGINAKFINSSTKNALGTECQIDFLKLTNLNWPTPHTPGEYLGYDTNTLTASDNFPRQSMMLRSGQLDVLQLYETTLTNSSGNKIKLNNITVEGKPYGSSFFLSEPGSSSCRPNYEGYSNITNFKLGNISNSPPGIYSSPNGLTARIFDPNNVPQLCQLQFKSVENYENIKSTNTLENLEMNVLNYSNNSNPQYFKNNSSKSQKFNEGDAGTSWQIVPKSLYPTQDFITGIVGNIYYQNQIILYKPTDTLYKVKKSILTLTENWTSSSDVEEYDIFNNLMESNENNFYTFVVNNSSDVDNFGTCYRSIEMVSNLNDQNLPLLVKDFGKEVGKTVEQFSYIDFKRESDKNYFTGTEGVSNFINNYYSSNFGVSDFQNFKILKFDEESFFGLGFTPVGSNGKNLEKINFLENNISSGEPLSQYIYSIERGACPSVIFDKPYCIGKNSGTNQDFKISRVPAGDDLTRFDFANSLMFNISPCNLESQNLIKYNWIEPVFPAYKSGLIKYNENYPIINNHFPGVGVPNPSKLKLLLNYPITSLGVSFRSSYIGMCPGILSHTFKINEELPSDNSSVKLKILDLGYSIFSENCLSGVSDFYNTSSGFCIGDYWYIKDKIKDNDTIPTFGYIVPSGTTLTSTGGSVNTYSFIQLKDLESPLTSNANMNFITSGGSIPNINTYLNKSDKKYLIKNYEMIPNTNFSSSEIISENFYNGTKTNTLFQLNSLLYNNTYQNTNTALFKSDVSFSLSSTIDDLYMPIRNDYDKYINCKIFSLFGFSNFSKVKYSLNSNEQYKSLEGTNYNPLISDPYNTEVFLNNNLKYSTQLADGTEKRLVTNVQDTILLSKKGDKFTLFSNPFSHSLTNKYVGFSENAFIKNTNKYKPLGVISSQATTNLISKGCCSVAFYDSGISVSNIMNSLVLGYTPFSPPKGEGSSVPGQSNFLMNLSELRRNTKTYFVEEKNNCSMYHGENYANTDLLQQGGILYFSYTNDNGFNITDSTNGAYMKGTSFTIAKNLEYTISQSNNSSKDNMIIGRGSESNLIPLKNFSSGTSIVEIYYTNKTNQIISYEQYIKSVSPKIKLKIQDNYDVSTPYKLYFGATGDSGYINTGSINIITNY